VVHLAQGVQKRTTQK